jgi:hypothetical protein
VHYTLIDIAAIVVGIGGNHGFGVFFQILGIFVVAGKETE